MRLLFPPLAQPRGTPSPLNHAVALSSAITAAFALKTERQKRRWSST